MDIRNFIERQWRRFLDLRLSQKALLVGGLFVLVIIILTILRSGATTDTGNALPSVTLESIGSLSGSASGTNFVGSVRSESQADIIAQSSGTVTSVNASVGQSVPAGFVLAELENASQRAAVLQAQGAYDGAIAAQGAVSPVDSKTAAVNAYRAGYSTLDIALQNYADTFFGGPTAYGPALLISAPMYPYGTLSQARAALTDELDAYQRALAGADNADPAVLLTQATSVAQDASDFLDKLAVAANARDSNATAAQLAALATARSSVNGVLSTLAAARQALRSQSVTSTTSAGAAVEAALGGLHAAEANLEKTRIRAPIAGTVNFLPLHVGDFVSPNQRVATVAQNGALEIVSFVSEDVRNSLTVGSAVTVGTAAKGTVTSIAPALDPVTKQIEVHVAVDASSGLVNGQSVSVALSAPAKTTIVAATTTATTTSSVLLPLASVKLASDERDLFTVGADSRLVAMPVTVGDVVGDRIQITTLLDPTLLIVSDARGLSSGEKVLIASSTPE